MNLSLSCNAPRALLLLLLSACSARSSSASRRPSPEVPATGSTSERNDSSAIPESTEHSPSALDVVIPVTPSDPQWGETDAPVTLVQFADFECPFSAQVASTLDALRKRYGPHRLRVVFKSYPLPFHPQASAAHEAAVAIYSIAGPEPFRRYTQLVFSRRPELSPSSLEVWAEEVGIPRNELRRELASGRPALKVAADLKLAGELGVRGTPEFFINGIALIGARTEEQFATVVDRELTAAKDLDSADNRMADVYPRRLKENFRILRAQGSEHRRDGYTVDPERVRVRIPVRPTDPVRGPGDALVTIVMFSDFQCPFSRRTVATLDEIQSEYESRIRLVYKDNPLPFHPHAGPAAKVARYIHAERGNEAFWAAFEQLFGQQEILHKGRDLEGLFARTLSTAGLTLADYQRADVEQLEAEISESRKLALQLKAPSTPYFFVNGRRLPGAQPFENFKAMIDAELRIVAHIVAEGTPRSAVYDALMETADPAEPPTTTGNSMP